MPKIIEIEGGLVRIIERNVVSEVALADALPFMENRVPVILPVLPRNSVRSAMYDESNPHNKRLELLVTLDPGVRTLSYTRPIVGLPPRIALPYTVFYFSLTSAHDNPRGDQWSFDNTRIYFARERITDLNQWVIPAILPNVYMDGRICFGTTAVNANQPLSDRIDELVNNWYLTEFTDHHVREQLFPWKSKSYRRWARKTQTNPNCWQDFPEWDRADLTTSQQHIQLRSIFETPMPRTVPIALPDGIPDLVFNPTFGRAEEWARTLTGTQRQRLLVSLGNLHAEDPTLFTADAPAPIADNADEDEDDDQ